MCIALASLNKRVKLYKEPHLHGSPLHILYRLPSPIKSLQKKKYIIVRQLFYSLCSTSC